MFLYDKLRIMNAFHLSSELGDIFALYCKVKTCQHYSYCNLIENNLFLFILQS